MKNEEIEETWTGACGDCDGTGSAECPVCEGEGKCNSEDCTNCDGDGWVTCPDCEGSGKATYHMGRKI